MMYVRERLLSIRLAERLKKQPALAKRLAIEVRESRKSESGRTSAAEKK
ncbi:MAG: hypothetical protein IKX57_08140 [Oscillospiraceae bacterium]|nr:hypothetical protein [Oscillospiraceae bacterium]